VVPDRDRAEVALLKAVAAVYVMGRPEAAALQEREREVVSDLVRALADRPEELEPSYRQTWEAAGDDPARLRVVVDQVAALTDAAAWGLHARLT
jgi:dGTPase